MNSFSLPLTLHHCDKEDQFNTLLAESAEEGLHYNLLFEHIEHQKTNYTCGFATTALFFNSFAGQQVATDVSLLEAAIEQGDVDKDVVAKEGLTLDKLYGLVKLEESDTLERVFASDVTEQEMKSKMLACLEDPDARVCLNYHMSTAGQEPNIGHFSALVGSHAATDSVLVIDIGQHAKAGPTWLHWPKVWDAMQHVDGCAQKSRGLLVFRRNKG